MQSNADTSTQESAEKFTGYRKEGRGFWCIWIEGVIITTAKNEEQAQSKFANEVRRHAEIMTWKAQQAAKLAAEVAGCPNVKERYSRAA